MDVNVNTYLALVPINECKNTLKSYEELWNKIKCLITSKINLDNDLPLKKTLELRNRIIVVRAVFHKGNYVTVVIKLWFLILLLPLKKIIIEFALCMSHDEAISLLKHADLTGDKMNIIKHKN